MQRDDDQLFLQCLVVVLTVASALLFTLILAPPPSLAWDADPAESGQPWESARPVRVLTRSFLRPARGPDPAPAPLQTGAPLQGVVERIFPPPSPSPLARRREPPPAPAVTAGPVGQLTLLQTEEQPGPAAVRSALRELGGEGEPGMGTPYRPQLKPLPPPTLPQLPVRLEADPIQIVVRRPTLLGNQAETRAAQEDEDPLPEFRRFLPRAELCAHEVSRRAGEPVRGKVVLRFTVEPTGWVSRARAVGGSLRDPDAERCLVEQLRAEPYFEPRGVAITAERAVIFAK
ncbi:MAG: hypothetical protein AB2A00_42395 [Myxococcota bacterium]